MASLTSPTTNLIPKQNIKSIKKLSPDIQKELDAITKLYLNDERFIAADRLETLLRTYQTQVVQDNQQQEDSTQTLSTEEISTWCQSLPETKDNTKDNTKDTTKDTTKDLTKDTTKDTTTDTTTDKTDPQADTTNQSTIPPLPPLPSSFSSNNHSPIARVYRICREFKHVMKEFQTTNGWALKTNLLNSADEIWYKLEEDGTHSFRVEGFIDAPLFNLLALVYEFDLFPLWFPLLTHATEVCVPSRFSKFANIVAWAPWPMAHRECLLRGYGDVYDGDSVAIFAKDAVDEDLLGTSCQGKVELPIEGANGTVRMNVHKCGFHFTPVVDEKALIREEQQRQEKEKKEEEQEKKTTDTKPTKKKKKREIGAGGRVLTKVFFNVDLKIDFLPDMLLNLIIGKFCGALLLLVRKYAHPKKMLGSEYERRIAANTEVYDEMKRRIDTSLTTEKILQNAAKYGTKRQLEVLKGLQEVTA